MAKRPRLDRVAAIDLPVREASGLAVVRDGDSIQVLVVGDDDSTLAVSRACAVGDIADLPDSAWERADLSTIPEWPVQGASQFEAVAVDGGGLVALLREDPPSVLVVDRSRWKLVADIVLDARELLGDHWDDGSSRGEGLVLLRHGRLLVAKEKEPAVFIEFAPTGRPARGVGRADFLAEGEEWEAPTGRVTYVAVASWRLRGEVADHFADVSSVVAADDGLWLLSDQSRALGRLDLDEPLDPERHELDTVDAVWRLPKKTRKPEGLAVLGCERFLVALDRKRTTRNGVVVASR